MNKTIEKNIFFNLIDNILPGYDINNNNIIKNLSSEIYFEKLSLNGLEEMHKYSIDPRLYEYFEFEPFKNINETKLYIEKLINRMSGKEEKNAIYWFVRRRIDNRLIGTAGLLNISYSRKSTEWGYGVDPELWGNGYILQIQEILKKYVFEILQLNRLDGITMMNNERTKSSLIASGMINEGIIRDYYCKNGKFIDGWKYSMLRDEYFKQADSSIIKKLNKFSRQDIVKILNEVLEEEVNEQTTMYNSHSWDSINHMNIIVKIHEIFKINLSPIQISNATSVESFYMLLNNLPKSND